MGVCPAQQSIIEQHRVTYFPKVHNLHSLHNLVSSYVRETKIKSFLFLYAHKDGEGHYSDYADYAKS
jgi:hypothetical protein